MAALDPNDKRSVIPAVEAAELLRERGIKCKVRYLGTKTPRGIRLLKQKTIIPADKLGYVPLPLVQEIITLIQEHEQYWGKEYLDDKAKAAAA